MTDNDIKRAVEERVSELVAIVQKGGLEFVYPAIEYYDDRLDAGRCCYQTHTIAFNIVHLRENLDDMLHDTVAHEIAHLVVYAMVKAGRAPESTVHQPHGRCWKGVMRHKFGVEPKALHDYNSENVKVRRQRRWAAKCACQLHEITTVRRNRMRRQGVEYRCRSCKVCIELMPSQ